MHTSPLSPSTITILPDDGEVIVFDGIENCRFEVFESSASSIRLDVTVYTLTNYHPYGAMARVLEKNLSHPNSGVCHSTNRLKSIAPRQVQKAFLRKDLQALCRALSKEYPNSGIKELLVQHLGESAAFVVRPWYSKLISQWNAWRGR